MHNNTPAELVNQFPNEHDVLAQNLMTIFRELSIEPSPIVDPKIQSDFLELFVKAFMDVLNRAWNTFISSIHPSFRDWIMKNPSLLFISEHLSTIYACSPQDIRNLYNPVKSLLASFLSKDLKDFPRLDSQSRSSSKALIFTESQLNTLEHLIQVRFSSSQESQIIEEILRIVPRNDTVDILDDSFQIRRLDSLARLLAVHHDISVCTAVTFYNDKVIIGSNNSDTSGQEIVSLLIKRFSFIRAFIQTIQSEYDFKLQHLYDPRTLQYQQEYQALLYDFVEKLNTLYAGSPFSHTVLSQAITKLIYSSISHIKHDSSLSDSDRYCLLESSDISALTVTRDTDVPEIYAKVSDKRSSKLLMVEGKLTPHGAIHKRYLPLPIKNAGLIRKFHAEQLIALYLLNSKWTTSILSQAQPIGVSKLCCPTCHAALSSTHLFAYRGTHHSRKLGVENVLGLKIVEKLIDEPILSDLSEGHLSVTNMDGSHSNSNSTFNCLINSTLSLDKDVVVSISDTSSCPLTSISMLSKSTLFNSSLSPVQCSKKSRAYDFESNDSFLSVSTIGNDQSFFETDESVLNDESNDYMGQPSKRLFSDMFQNSRRFLGKSSVGSLSSLSSSSFLRSSSPSEKESLSTTHLAQTNALNMHFQSPTPRRKLPLTKAHTSPFISPGFAKALQKEERSDLKVSEVHSSPNFDVSISFNIDEDPNAFMYSPNQSNG